MTLLCEAGIAANVIIAHMRLISTAIGAGAPHEVRIMADGTMTGCSLDMPLNRMGAYKRSD
jgi:hypothetical protein